jgi:esterase/lipase
MFDSMPAEEVSLAVRLRDGKVTYGRLREHVGSMIFVSVHGINGSCNEHLHYNFARYVDQAGYSSFRFDLYSGAIDARRFAECTPEVHADDVDDVIAELRERTGGVSVVLVGHSLGGLVTLLAKSSVDCIVLWDATHTDHLGWLDESLQYNESLDCFIRNGRVDYLVGHPMVESLKKIDSNATIKRATSPIIVTTAELSPNQPAALKYFEQAKGPKSFFEIANADHTFTIGESASQLFNETLAHVGHLVGNETSTLPE